MKSSLPTVLVVDHDSDATRRLIAFLRQNGLEVVWARDGEAAFNALDARRFDCLVTELHAPGIDGGSLLSRAIERNPEVCAVVVTGQAEIEKAVESMRQGAYDFQLKPLLFEKLLAVLRRGLSHQALAARVVEIEGQLDERLALDTLTGSSRAIHRVMDQVRSIAGTRAAVLIEGESGSGKGLVAQAIHRQSARREGPMVAVDLAALAAPMVEVELFGLEGSGHAPRTGRLEAADGGTLYLDGIETAPPAVQVRLLRFLRDRDFERVGGSESLRVDARLVAATDRDLAGEVRQGRFREDLLDRLGGVRISMPSLRERREDIPLLVEAFLREFNHRHQRRVTGITRGALDRLVRHDWPGNVHELRNTIEGMVALVGQRRELEPADLPPPLRDAQPGAAPLDISVGMTVEEAERRLIEATLAETGDDKPRAASMLGIGLRTLYRKIQRYRRMR
jgi:DNA-binding NtrC family response regulator